MSDLAPPVANCWRPLIDGALADAATEVVAAIATDLVARLDAMRDASLGRGLAGMAVLFAYLDEAWPGRGYRPLTEVCLERAVAAVAEQPMPPSLYGGFTGIAWAMEHLTRRGRAEADAGECEELVMHALDGPWRSDADLISGCVGGGVYALERLPKPDGARILAAVIARLDAMAERQGGGRTWFTPPGNLIPATRASYPRGYYNLGLAHGAPGMIALIGQACAGAAPPGSRALLDDALAWMWSQRLADAAPSCFPYWVGPDIVPSPARSAWCYGDPGIAACCMLAARGAGLPGLEQRALTLARRWARRPAADMGVNDAGLCHGAAGLALIAGRMHAASGDPLFRDLAHDWCARLLELRGSGGIGGYRAFQGGVPGTPPSWHDEPGLLEGAAGVALALTAAISAIEPCWDRVLLLSSAVAPTGEDRA